MQALIFNHLTPEAWNNSHQIDSFQNIILLQAFILFCTQATQNITSFCLLYRWWIWGQTMSLRWIWLSKMFLFTIVLCVNAEIQSWFLQFSVNMCLEWLWWNNPVTSQPKHIELSPFTRLSLYNIPIAWYSWIYGLRETVLLCVRLIFSSVLFHKPSLFIWRKMKGWLLLIDINKWREREGWGEPV